MAIPWFKVDDNLAIHPKVIRAGNEAMGLWARAGSWSAQQLTEGFVPADIVTLLQGDDVAPRLVAAGLWFEADGGYTFHEWDERQPTKESVLADRQASRERQKRAREKAKSQRESRGVSRRDFGVTDGVTHAVSHGDVTPVVTVPPTRPDPTLPTSKEVEGTRKRGHRLPDDFAITEPMVAWAREKAPGVDGKRATEMFMNHWQSATGRTAVKSDWVKAWRNWLLSDQQRAEERGWKPDETKTRRTFNDADD